jgi:uncharacterized protein DUF5134
MMPPTGLLDVVAALMLVVAAMSATRLATAWLPASRLSVAESAGSRSWLRASGGADADIAHLLMGIAMAGMLAASARTLSPRAWVVIFGVLTAWFAWRSTRGIWANGARSLASGHCALPLFHSAAMVYMFAALTTSGGMQMTGMGSGAAQSLRYPPLALAFALVLACYSAWDLYRLSGRRKSLWAATSVGAAPADGSAPADGAAPTAVAAVLTATTPAITAQFGAATSSPVAPGTTVPPRALLQFPAATTACRIVMGATMVFMLLIML